MLLLLLVILVAGLTFVVARPRLGDGLAIVVAVFAALLVVLLLGGADGSLRR